MQRDLCLLCSAPRCTDPSGFLLDSRDCSLIYQTIRNTTAFVIILDVNQGNAVVTTMLDVNQVNALVTTILDVNQVNEVVTTIWMKTK